MYTVEIFLVKNKELVSLFADQRQRSKFTSKEQEHCQNFLRVENCNQLSRNTIALWFNKKKKQLWKKEYYSSGHSSQTSQTNQSLIDNGHFGLKLI